MKKLLIRLTYVVYLLLLVEAASRTFVAIEWKASFLRPRDAIYAYYPELRRPAGREITDSDERFDVLLLGASVLDERWGNIPDRLKAGFAQRLGRPVMIHNLAVRAQTSLDSYYKYLHLAGKRFDLVIVYHGINEVRANNVPPQLFREDYSHYHWYAEIRRIHAHRELSLLSFPYVASHAAARMRQQLGFVDYLPRDVPREDWVAHGAEIKTVGPFRRNLERIIELARHRGEPLVLMTFAFHLPEGGWPERFDPETSSWGVERTETALWGLESNVVAGIEAHNAVLRSLAAQHPDVMFVDQNRRIPKDEEHFTDICHLTWSGCRVFADNLLELADRIPAR